MSEILKKIARKIFKRKPVLNTKLLFNNYRNGENSFLPKKIDFEKVTPLCEIMKAKGSDKGMYAGIGKHNYTTFYYAVFNTLIDRPVRLFELGIGTNNVELSSNMGEFGRPGASLRGWKTFFNKGEIFSADIDQSILFNEEKISTFFCDQTNPELINDMWKQDKLKGEFDIIIDDGLHTFKANQCFFENSHQKLKVGGIFIVEDVLISELQSWKEYIKLQTRELINFRFTIVVLPNQFNNWDNNLIAITRIY